MVDTRLFREQHRRILQKATEVSQLLKADELSDDAMKARLAVAELAGQINIHLAMEDESLYPALTNSESDDVRDTANRYIEEMGGLGAEFRDYIKVWAHSNRAQTDAHRFIKETHDMLKKLSDRIYREDNELYQMVDQMREG